MTELVHETASDDNLEAQFLVYDIWIFLVFLCRDPHLLNEREPYVQDRYANARPS